MGVSRIVNYSPYYAKQLANTRISSLSVCKQGKIGSLYECMRRSALHVYIGDQLLLANLVPRRALPHRPTDLVEAVLY